MDLLYILVVHVRFILFFAHAIYNGNRTEWRPVQSIIIQVITKSDYCTMGVQFVNHKYDYRQNWVTQSPVTNQSKLWQNLRKKLWALIIGFHKRKTTYTEKSTTTAPVCTWHLLLTYTSMICQLSYYTVQLQAWHMHHPVSAQIALVITSHVQ